MDALASLAFGIVVVNAIRGTGVTRPESVATSTVRAGLFSCLIMAGIYIVVTLMGVQSRTIPADTANGGEVLSLLANRYYGTAGTLILGATVTLACLKTSVGLVTSCAETFVAMFPRGPGYKVWALLFSGLPFLIANVGLTAILDWSLPVLMLLYPLAITLILLGLTGKWFGHDPLVYRLVTVSYTHLRHGRGIQNHGFFFIAFAQQPFSGCLAHIGAKSIMVKVGADRRRAFSLRAIDGDEDFSGIEECFDNVLNGSRAVRHHEDHIDARGVERFQIRDSFVHIQLRRRNDNLIRAVFHPELFQIRGIGGMPAAGHVLYLYCYNQLSVTIVVQRIPFFCNSSGKQQENEHCDQQER